MISGITAVKHHLYHHYADSDKYATRELNPVRFREPAVTFFREMSRPSLRPWQIWCAIKRRSADFIGAVGHAESYPVLEPYPEGPK